MENLRFLVQGSAQTPYQVTVVGNGVGLEIFCTCPAGRRQRKFCKHVASLLNGVVDKLVPPSDDVELLRSRAIGSPLSSLASGYVASSERDSVSGCSTIEEIYDTYRTKAEELGWVVEFVVNDGEFPSKEINLHDLLKNGKPRKAPKIQLIWEKLTYDLSFDDSDYEVRENIREKVKPYLVRVSGSGSAVSYKALEKALYRFLTEAKIIDS